MIAFESCQSEQSPENAGNSNSVGPARPSQQVPGTQQDAALLDAYSQAVIGVVNQVGPAVVSISGQAKEGTGGQGSGFIITPDGFALTNSHVVHGRDRLRAVTEEGDTLDARVIGDDPSTDLALIRLTARDLPHAELGDSDILGIEAKTKWGHLLLKRLACGYSLGIDSPRLRPLSTPPVHLRQRPECGWRNITSTVCADVI